MLYYQHFAFALSFLSGFKAATQWGIEQTVEEGYGGGRVSWSAACDGKEESEAIRLNWFTVEQRKQIYLF